MAKAKPDRGAASAGGRDGGQSNNRPVHEVRAGLLKVSVWENTGGESGKYFSVTCGRAYKQGDKWHTAASFGRNDVLVLALLLQRAFEWMAAQNGKAGENGDVPF